MVAYYTYDNELQVKKLKSVMEGYNFSSTILITKNIINTDNMLYLPSKEKLEKIKKLLKEMIQEKARLAKINCVSKHYNECKGISQLKVENIINMKEVQSFVKLIGKQGEVLSLFGLSDSEISAFYGDITLDSKEKQCLKDEINNHILDTFSNSSMIDNKASSFLDKKKRIAKLYDILQSKIKTCLKLLTMIEEYLNQLAAIQSRNEKNKDSHTSQIVHAAQDLSLKAKAFKLMLEEVFIVEDENIVKAMDVLRDELDCLIFKESLKLRQLNTTAEEYTEVDGKEFQSLLKTYKLLLKSFERHNFLLQTLNKPS